MKTIKIKIDKSNFLHVATGHKQHITGTGVHRNLKADKKLRRKFDKVVVE